MYAVRSARSSTDDVEGRICGYVVQVEANAGMGEGPNGCGEDPEAKERRSLL